MQRTRIKICGITRVEDAACAVDAGADALGFVFYPPSPRAVTVAQAARLLAVVPAFVSRVGLFVNASRAEIASVLDQAELDVLQFHGDETPADCVGHGRRWIKALRMAPELDPYEAAAPYLEAGAAGILLDAWDATRFGGSGQSFDWSRASAGRDWPLILAGGLAPDNVREAVACVQPYAVDVSSGVESRPGIKDAARVRAFCQQLSRSTHD